MIEVLLTGVGLTLAGAACIAVHQATTLRYQMALKARDSHADYLEHENEKLRAEIRRLSVRPPPMPWTESMPSIPASIPPASLAPFVTSGGSIVPPPPAYLFELPKQVSAVEFPPSIPAFEPSPISKRLSSISTLRRVSTVPPAPLPPPPLAPSLTSFEGQFVDDNAWFDDEPPPSTLRSDQCARIAESLRPPALGTGSIKSGLVKSF